jgi:predicted MFS family arabinose efflux permease
MLSVALVLFVLSRYHSPQLAGAATSLLLLPGLLLSPIAGALLDRYGRARLVTLDYLIAAATLILIAGLSARHALSAPVLLAICGVASLTGPLSAAGARSLFPILVPSHLWERANAFDSSSHVLSHLIGAPLAGVLVALAGGEWALVAAAALFAAAGIAMLSVRDPGSRHADSHVLADAWRGLVYVVRDRTIGGIALTLSVWSVGWGCMVITMPVLVLGQLHQGAATVGYLWGLMGAAGVVSALITGRMRTAGRERQLMVVSILLVAAGMAAIPLAPTIGVVAIAMTAIGFFNGPFDIALFTLRQRRTDPARFGRVFAVSMSLNTIGSPIGSALAGPLIAWSLEGALWVAVALSVLAAVFPILVIPGEGGLAVKQSRGKQGDETA